MCINIIELPSIGDADRSSTLLVLRICHLPERDQVEVKLLLSILNYLKRVLVSRSTHGISASVHLDILANHVWAAVSPVVLWIGPCLNVQHHLPICVHREYQSPNLVDVQECNCSLLPLSAKLTLDIVNIAAHIVQTARSVTLLQVESHCCLRIGWLHHAEKTKFDESLPPDGIIQLLSQLSVHHDKRWFIINFIINFLF